MNLHRSIESRLIQLLLSAVKNLDWYYLQTIFQVKINSLLLQ